MRSPLRSLTGLGLLGYGLLVLTGVVAHEATVAAWISLALGAALLLSGLPPILFRSHRVVAALGLFSAGGVLLYNILRSSTLSPPEWAILLYGIALVASAPHLHKRIGRTELGTIVAWSFPLLLAPLGIYAFNALVTGQTGELAAAPYVHALVVVPTAFVLNLVGTPVEIVENNMILTTPRGLLVLGVGLVCAGLYPMILFAGMVALHGWNRGLPPARFAAYLGVGLVALWALNILRLVLLTEIGKTYGPAMLQTAHAHIGWILFAIFTIVYWTIVLRVIEKETLTEKTRPDPVPTTASDT
jgi:archaeosortase C (PEF-CTERM variant)